MANVAARTRRKCTYAALCSCGCCSLVMPGAGIEGRYGARIAVFVNLQHLFSFVRGRSAS
jgi:hypothetical protein